MSIYYPGCRINISAVFDGFGGPDTPSVITDVIPYSANVHLNSYKEADTWEVTFDAKRFPFSPDLLRSAAIEVYMFALDGLTDPRSWADLSNLVTTGLVDQATLTEDDEGGKISFTGRDYTALMIDRQWDPTRSSKNGRVPDGDLHTVVQQLVDEATNSKLTGRTLTVKFFDTEDDPTVRNIAETILHKKQKIPKTTHARHRKPKGISVKADSTYWDVIYKLCLSYGYIVYVQGFDVIITRPHVLQGLAATQYRVAYGRNLESLEVERKMSKEATPQIKVRSYDPASRTVIEGEFPSEKDVQAQMAGRDKKGKGGGFLTGVGTKREEFKVFTVPDIADKNVLTEIARSTYYTLARGEGVVRFSTPALTDLTNQDLLKMRAADSVEIVWDAFNAEIMSDPHVTREQKITTLLSLGYKIDVATLVADQFAKLDYFRQPFYVKEVNLTWSRDHGIKVDCEAMNFIKPESSRFKK